MQKLNKEQIEGLDRSKRYSVEDIIHLRYRLYSTRRSGNYWEAWKDDGYTEATEEIKNYLNNSPYCPVLEFASKEAVIFYNLPVHNEEDARRWKKAVVDLVQSTFDDKNNYILVLQYHECYTVFPNYVDIIAFSTSPKLTISPYKLRKRIVELLLNEMKRMNTDFDELQGNLRYIRFRGLSRSLSLDAEKEIKEIIRKLKDFGVYLPSKTKLFNHILEADYGIFIPADNYRVLIPKEDKAIITVTSPDHILQPHNETVDCITLFYHPFPLSDSSD